MSPGHFSRVALRMTDGGTCPDDACISTVIILDNDGMPTAPRNLSLVPGHREVSAIWNAPADDGGRPVTKHQYRVSANGGTDWEPDWTDIPDSAPQGANAHSYTVTGLTNGVEHTISGCVPRMTP